MMKFNKGDFSAIDFLEQAWPDKQTKNIKEAFAKIKAALKEQPASQKKQTEKKVTDVSRWPGLPDHTSGFDLLELIRRTLMSHDMLFLGKQVTYHISASTEIPKAWGDRDRVAQALSHLIEHMVKRSDRSSSVNIEISEFALRSGKGVKVSFESSDSSLDSIDSRQFLDNLLKGTKDEQTGISLSSCREIITGQHGQMWSDVPAPHHPFYHILLPASEEVARQPQCEQQTFKYDIAITNYANVRKRFGIKKSASLVAQIEHYVRTLVRYPMDMVMAISDKGMVTTIYETQKGAASSVASRISEKLGREEFRIGRRPVELSFKYQLSQLKSNSEDAKSSSQATN